MLNKWFDYLYNIRQLRKIDCSYPSFPTINGRILVSLFAQSGKLKFGQNVVINSSAEANPVGGERTSFIFMDNGAEIILDDGAGISNVTLAAATRIYIGKGVFLGAGCRIYDTDFHSIYYEERIPDNVGIVTKPVTIEDRVFIGAFTTILKGVTIGHDSVVGACSLVTKDIPPGEIWGGNPARFLKKLPPYEKRPSIPKFIRT